MNQLEAIILPSSEFHQTQFSVARFSINPKKTSFFKKKKTRFSNQPQENQNNGFPKRHKKCDYVFHIGNEMIDILQDYTYLGTRISSPGNFTL